MALTPNQIGLLIADVGVWQPVGQRIGANPPRDLTPEDVKRKIIAFYDTAIAVCLAESGGNPQAKNPSSSASGLWQIMVSVHGDKIRQAQQEIIADHGLSDVPNIFDPRVNTLVAARVYQEAGKSWKPWEVYTLPKSDPRSYTHFKGHGAKVYAFLYSPAAIQKGVDQLLAEQSIGFSTAQMAAYAVPGGVLAANASGAWNVVQPILEFVAKAGMTAGAFVVGVLLVILGVWFVISNTKVGQSIKGITPIGRARKLLK